MTVFESQAECKRFKQITEINPWDYKDNIMIAATNSFQLDIIKMDEFLQTKYPDEYKEDMSMSDFLVTKFGEEANGIIDRMIK